MLQESQAQAIAYRLAREDSRPWAFLECEGTVYCARQDRGHGFTPTSAVTRLIQGVYGHHPRMARKIVRSRIYSSTPFTEMCLGMIKVAAKRASHLSAPREDEGTASAFAYQDVGETECGLNRDFAPRGESTLPSGASGDWEYLKLAEKHSLEIPRPADARLFEQHRPVAALLVSPDGKILEAALNANAANRTLHAEINLIQAYYRKNQAPLPRGSKIYTTLKPCKMCAGMIWTAAEDFRAIEVVYGEFDPGPNARVTILDPGSPERRRAAPQDLSLNLERLLELRPSTASRPNP